MAVDAATPAAGMTEHNESPTPGDSVATELEDHEDQGAEPQADAEGEANGVANPDDDVTAGAARRNRSRLSWSPVRLAAIAGVVAVMVVGALAGWLGFQAHGAHQQKAEHDRFLQVARQGALNLTTIGFQEADTDVARILDSATGEFRDEFQRNEKPFVDVVKQAKSSSAGAVSEAGLESVTGDTAQAIVAMTVRTSVVGAPEAPPRSWRMRLTVQRSGDDFKISKVAFI